MMMIGSTDCWLLALIYEEQAVKYSTGSVARGAGEINTPLPTPLPACFFNSPSSRANELVLKIRAYTKSWVRQRSTFFNGGA
jgi:hypothetical protein